MAYCKKCGAYLPDNFTKCLACGYDETEEREAAAKAAEAASADSGGRAYQFSSDELKKQLEQQRKKQQEASRRWAEQERSRRQAARSASEASENSGEAGEYKSAKKAKGSAAISNKVLAALSYLSVLCLLPFFLCPEDEYARFHAKQGLRLLIFSAVSDLLSAIPVIGWVFPVFRVYCIYKGMTAANDGRCDPLPYIGTLGNF